LFWFDFPEKGAIYLSSVLMVREIIMNYAHGDRVRILGKPEWGPGFIQGVCKNGKVKVRFLEAGRKTLNLQHAKLMKVALRDPDWLVQRAKEVWERNQQARFN
jgi:hypothetical protein